MTELEKLKAARDVAFAAYYAAAAAYDAARDARAARDTYYAALAAQTKEPTDD